MDSLYDILDIPETLKDAFFIITPDNAASMPPGLFGYAITDTELLAGGVHVDIPVDASGCWVNIVRDGDALLLRQDFLGGMGLFLYQKGDYFAISNSYLHLIRFLTGKATLTINEDFFDLYIALDIVPLAFRETPIVEIMQVPPFDLLAIDVTRGVLERQSLARKLWDVPLDSPEAFEMIDRWHAKYASLLRSLLGAGMPVSMDLSGGKDSRTALSVANDLAFAKQENFSIYSEKDGLHTHAEDLKIAAAIASLMGLPLNRRLPVRKTDADSGVRLAISFYAKFMFHSQFYHRSIFKDHIFKFTGAGGGGGSAARILG